MAFTEGEFNCRFLNPRVKIQLDNVAKDVATHIRGLRERARAGSVGQLLWHYPGWHGFVL